MINTAPCMLGEGCILEIDEKRCQIVSINRDKIWLEWEDDKQELVSRDVMAGYIRDNRANFDVDATHDNVIYINSDKALTREMQVMQAYMRALDNERKPYSVDTRVRVIKEIGDEYEVPEHQRPKYSSLRNYHKKWIASGQNVFELFKPKTRNKGSTFHPALQKIIDDVIENEYLRLGGETEAECLRIITTRFKEQNIPGNCIKKSRFNQIINKLNGYEVKLAREGRDAAKRYAKHTKGVLHADFPLQAVEVDACHLRVGIICEKTGVFLGTLILYVAIDRCTRYVLGYAMSIKGGGSGENTGSVLDLFRHMIQPKQTMTHTEIQWDGYGTPILIICDAGLAFNNKFIKAFVGNINSSIKTTEKGSPEKKPFIERFFLTVRLQYAVKLPGYQKKRKDNIQYKKSIEHEACLYLSEAKELFEKWVVETYHQSPHKGLELDTPHNVWHELTSNGFPKPRTNIAQLEAFRGAEDTRTLIGGNIEIEKFKYYSDAARELFFRLKKPSDRYNPKVTILYNENDVSSITIVDEENCALIVCPCTDPRIVKGTSLAEAKAWRKVTPKTNRAKPKSLGEGNDTLKLIKSRQAAIQKEHLAASKKKKASDPTPAEEVTEEDAKETINTQNGTMNTNYSGYKVVGDVENANDVSGSNLSFNVDGVEACDRD